MSKRKRRKKIKLKTIEGLVITRLVSAHEEGSSLDLGVVREACSDLTISYLARYNLHFTKHKRKGFLKRLEKRVLRRLLVLNEFSTSEKRGIRRVLNLGNYKGGNIS